MGEQALQAANERYQTREDLHHAEAVESALRDVVEDQSATIEQLEAELALAKAKSSDESALIMQLQAVMDAQQDEIAHLQGELARSGERECVCGGGSQS